MLFHVHKSLITCLSHTHIAFALFNHTFCRPQPNLACCRSRVCVSTRGAGQARTLVARNACSTADSVHVSKLQVKHALVQSDPAMQLPWIAIIAVLTQRHPIVPGSCAHLWQPCGCASLAAFLCRRLAPMICTSVLAW